MIERNKFWYQPLFSDLAPSIWFWMYLWFVVDDKMVSIFVFAVMVWFLSSLDNAQIDELDLDFMSFKFDLTFFNKSGIAFVVIIFNWPEIRDVGYFG